MRQTNRQSSSVGSGAQSFTVAGQDSLIDDLIEHTSMGYGGSMPVTESPYTSRHPPDASRPHASQSASSHRRRSQEEAIDPRKWTRSGY
jgi:hypothetical protein